MTFPASWYLVCRSDELRPGATLSRDFLGKPVVLFRGREDGAVHTLAAHCTHLGTHLGGGTVVGDCLRCPLHHWEYDGAGVCRRIPAAPSVPPGVRQFAYPTVERFGSVLVFNGATPAFDAPAFSAMDEADLKTAVGRAVALRCPWFLVAANGFDIQHLETVHERALREPPCLEILDAHRIRLRYVSRVTGRSAVDRVMRHLSRNRIAVTITCWGGSVVTVESDLGRVKSALLLGVLPTAAGVEVTPIFGVKRTGSAPVDTSRVALARWLFGGFLRRDVAILDDLRFRPRLLLPQDEMLRRYLEFVDALPVTPDAAPRPTDCSDRSCP